MKYYQKTRITDKNDYYNFQLISRLSPVFLPSHQNFNHVTESSGRRKCLALRRCCSKIPAGRVFMNAAYTMVHFGARAPNRLVYVSPCLKA